MDQALTRTHALLSQRETGKIDCVRHLHCGRLSPGARIVKNATEAFRVPAVPLTAVSISRALPRVISSLMFFALRGCACVPTISRSCAMRRICAPPICAALRRTFCAPIFVSVFSAQTVVSSLPAPPCRSARLLLARAALRPRSPARSRRLPSALPVETARALSRQLSPPSRPRWSKCPFWP